MRARLNALIVAVLTTTLLLTLAAPAAAYPRHSYLTLGNGPSFWLCEGGSFDLTFRDGRYENIRRDDRAGGRYRYNRDTGKVNLRSGHLDHLFAKFRKGPNEFQPWFLEVRKKSNRRLIAVCQPTTVGF